MDLNSLQHQLRSVLGTEYKSYQDSMRDWFGQKITKNFFDERMAETLNEEALEIHNEMMKQIIFLCSGTPAPAPTLTFNYNDNSQKITTNSSSTIVSSNGESPEESILPIKESKVFNELANEFESIQQQQQPYQTNGNLSIGQQIIIYSGGGDDESSSQNHNYITVNVVENNELMPYTRVEMVQEQEQDANPIVHVDWLYNADIVQIDTEENNSVPFLPPQNFSKLPIEYHSSSRVTNLTHGYDIADRLNKFPHLKPHFKQQPKDQPHLPPGSSLHGKFLLKAWECGLDGVDPACTQLVQEAVKEHIRKLVTELIKQRRSFRMRNDKVCHSIGAPYPNPYLRQGQHLFDTAYTSETTKMADVMQVPKLLSSVDELERIATLQVAASAVPKNGRFPATRATLADLLNVIENDPAIIPYSNLRFKMLMKIAHNYKGFGGNFSCDEEDDDFEEQNNLLPICSY